MGNRRLRPLKWWKGRTIGLAQRSNMTEAMRRTAMVSSRSAFVASGFSTAAWSLYADLLAVLTAVMLPWSTSAVAILMGLWLLSLIPQARLRLAPAFLRLLATPICLLPL